MKNTKQTTGKPARQVFQKRVLFSTLLAFLFLFAIQVMGQDEYTIADRHYIQSEDTWYLDWPETKQLFPVNMEVVTIKFNSDASQDEITGFQTDNQLTLLRQNILGFIDYQIQEGTNIFDFVKEALESSLIDNVDINTYGEYIITPNDPDFAVQWYLDQVSNADINAPEAWDIVTGCPVVKVGILDSGTDWDHEDLGMGSDTYQNIYLNPGEDAWSTPNNPATGNGVDDDGNLLIDDWKGWDFNNNNNDSRGPFWHGTHVAGVVAAKTNNNTGIAGVAGGWGNAGTSMLICGVGDFGPNGAILDDAILYAAQMGVNIIQMSLTVGPTAAIDAALQAAYQTNGIFISCAAGNTGSQPVTYPANNQFSFSVAATDQSDLKAGFSTFGTDLDLAAPGVNIYSTQIGNTYAYSDGTSFASPQVAGTAALMLCANPCLSNVAIDDILKTTSDEVGGYNYSYDVNKPGHSLELGYGRLDAHEAVYGAQQSYAPAIADLYSKDIPTDWGIEPDPFNGAMWISEDIWVRNINDGIEAHQNPEAGQTNWVYVKVRNRGCLPSVASSTVRVKLYWAKAATALAWPAHWNGSLLCSSPPFAEMGNFISDQLIPVIPPGGQHIFTFTWTPNIPNDYTNCSLNLANEPWHFCLLARIVDTSLPDDGMTFPEISALGANVKNNNNIVWKNLHVDNFFLVQTPDKKDRLTGKGGVVALGNVFDHPECFDLEFSLPDNYEGDPTKEQAEIKITMDERTWDIWRAGGARGENIEVVNEDKKEAIVTRNPGMLKNLCYDRDQWSTIHVGFNILADWWFDKKAFIEYNVIERLASDEHTVVGGEQYALRYDKDQERTTKPYGAENFTYKGIYPNPNNGSMQLDYTLGSGKKGELNIYDYTGRNIATFNLAEGKNTLAINESLLSSGVYIYQVKVNDKIVGTDKLVIIK